MPKPPKSIKPGSNKRTIQWGCGCKEEEIDCFTGCGISQKSGRYRVCERHQNHLSACLECNADYARTNYESNWERLTEEEKWTYQHVFLDRELLVKSMDEATQMKLLAELKNDQLADKFSIMLGKITLDMRYKVSAMIFGHFTEDVVDWPQEELYEWYDRWHANGEAVPEDGQH